MTKILFPVRVLLFSLLLVSVLTGTASICSASTGDEKTKPSRPTTHATTDLVGTWTGTFFSKHANVAAFTLTVVVAPDSQGRLIGSSTLNSDCLTNVRLEVTLKGSQVTLAGSDEEGNNITVRGTVDATGTMLKAVYILNGSASGRCEADGGTGSLAKR
jgi:hypothetical protein